MRATNANSAQQMVHFSGALNAQEARSYLTVAAKCHRGGALPSPCDSSETDVDSRFRRTACVASTKPLRGLRNFVHGSKGNETGSVASTSPCDGFETGTPGTVLPSASVVASTKPLRWLRNLVLELEACLSFVVASTKPLRWLRNGSRQEPSTGVHPTHTLRALTSRPQRVTRILRLCRRVIDASC